MSRKWLIPGSLVMAVPIVALIVLYAVGAYHLEIGGRALDAALGEIDPLNWWYIGPTAVQDRPALEQAIVHLEKARQHTHALRLLGRAHAARGDLLSSIETLRDFTAERPDSAMGHLELAAAYERANQRLQEMHSASLLEVLPGAVVSAPDLPGEMRYEPERWQSEYAYPTAFFLSPDEAERPTLFLHAGSQMTHTLTLTQPAVLSFAMGLDPRSLGWGSDGVTFEVFVDGARVFMEHLPVEVARGGWQERQVDLAVYTGQTIALSLASTPGPAGDVTADWAGWGDPRVEDAEAASYRQVVRGEPWEREWKRTGTTAQDFINAGEEARRAERYEEAISWYRRAGTLGALSASFYQSFGWGLLYEKQGLWERACSSFREAIKLSGAGDGFPGAAYYRIGVLEQDRLVRWEAAFESYGHALASGGFLTDADRADTYYRRGVILMYGLGDEVLARQEFLHAVQALPNHYGALIELGHAYWEQDRDFEKAARTLRNAIDANPQAPWAYLALGDLYGSMDQSDRALEMYEMALELAPSDEGIRQKVQAIRQSDNE